MGKIKNKEVVVEEVTEVTPATVVEKETKAAYPEVGATGRFVAVAVGDGFVVYNPSGQRATGIVDQNKANDIVRQQNQAAQIKG